MTASPAARLRAHLAGREALVVPGVWDAMSARLAEQAGFGASFMSGYAVSATRIGEPDAGLISYGEMISAGRDLCAATALPVIGDADTGFGNPMNVRRTVAGYHAAGFAAVMVEDQVFPKRCGYAQGVEVVARDVALTRLRAALDERDAIRARGGDVLVIGRTDSRAAADLDEALWRCAAFAGLGADIVYFEGPTDVSEMEALHRVVTGVPTMLAQVEKPGRPWLNAAQAGAIGYGILLCGVSLLNATMRAQSEALAALRGGGRIPPELLLPFDALYAGVGFERYYAAEARYATPSAE
ncbi:isocitrate lyase/PEP mutase family protein [Humitalea sp. 24SJ18S-53]|uniref:isocitrate lyase/PEP mutase family protein n=1 Tax=Humitalea sp. 24SJ18S-53 TaxID=3422307 RepID=UPI003D668209